MSIEHRFPALCAALAITLTPAFAAPPAGKPLKLEDVPGSPVKRITLTEKAVQRLGIELGKVSEAPIVRKQMVGGLVVAASHVKQMEVRSADGGFAGFGRPGAGAMLQPVAGKAATSAVANANDTWVLLSLSAGEWQRLAKDKPARLLPLATREELGKPMFARPSGMPPVEDSKRSMLNVYYVVPGADHGLVNNRRMRVELELEGSDEKRKVLPYSAVYYDAKGAPWVYLNLAPLVFQRQKIALERIAGDFAVLTEGPDVGTAVVTVGAPLLYGTEIFKK